MEVDSRNIVFPERSKVELRTEQCRDAGPGEVLCKAKMSLVSIGTEGHCLRGQFDSGTYWEDYIKYPFHPGYSMVGTVIAVGPGVDKHKLGDRVTSWEPHCEYFVASQDQVFPVPDTISDEDATWATLARTTQLGVRRAELAMGETVGVVGLGILGQLVTQYLSLCGASRIIAIDMAQHRLDLAMANGATHVLNRPVDKTRDAVGEITGGRMLDVVFDITGHPTVLAPASMLLRKLGRLVLLGDSPTPSKQALGPRIVGDSLSILGIHGFMYPDVATPFNRWTAEAMTSLFFDYVSARRMNVSSLVTHRFSPGDAETVYRDIALKPDSALGIIFDWDRLPPA